MGAGNRGRLHQLGRRALLCSFVMLLGGIARATAQEPKDDASRYVIVHDPIVVLRGVRIVDGTGAPPRDNQVLVLSRGIIQDAGDPASVAIPSQSRILDLPGRTVLPGLVMMHEHLFYRPGPDIAWPMQPYSFPRLFLAAGVTTIRTTGSSSPYVDLNLKHAIDEGQVPGPKMHVAGPFFNGYEGRHELDDKIVRDAEDARRAVSYWAGEGISTIKVYQGISREALEAIIDEAHKHGLKVTAHLASVSCATAAGLGIDNLEHGLLTCLREIRQPDSGELGRRSTAGEASAVGETAARLRILVRKLVDSKVALTSTPWDPTRPLSSREVEAMHPVARDAYLRFLVRPPAEAAQHRELLREGLRQFAAAGGVLLLGSDAGAPGRIAGFANHRVLESLVESGFTPLEAIKIATLNGATFLGQANTIGTIAVGKAADLLIVRGDPSIRIADVEKVETVFKDGVGYDPEALLAAVRGLVGWR